MCEKIKLEMDLERAGHLMRICELVARIGINQFDFLVESLRPDLSYTELCEISKNIKTMLDKSEGKGIRHDEVPEIHQVAWDAYQHIRREISWIKAGKDWRTEKRDWTGENSMYGVNYDEPFKVSRLPDDFKTERV